MPISPFYSDPKMQFLRSIHFQVPVSDSIKNLRYLKALERAHQKCVPHPLPAEFLVINKIPSHTWVEAGFWRPRSNVEFETKPTCLNAALGFFLGGYGTSLLAGVRGRLPVGMRIVVPAHKGALPVRHDGVLAPTIIHQGQGEIKIDIVNYSELTYEDCLVAFRYSRAPRLIA
jgi:hypothetical protein